MILTAILLIFYLPGMLFHTVRAPIHGSCLFPVSTASCFVCLKILISQGCADSENLEKSFSNHH